MEQSRFCVTNGSSAYFILKPSSTPERSQIQYWGMTEGDRDLATVGYVKNQLTVGGEEIDFGKFVKQDEFDTDQAAQDQLIAANRRSIEELEVTKGPVSRYECKGTSFNVASRNGDLYVSDATAANVRPSALRHLISTETRRDRLALGTLSNLSRAPTSRQLGRFLGSVLLAVMTQQP